MAGPGLQQVQRLSLQQILAPQLQQSLHLLQVPALELSALVHKELQQNPTLEELPKDEPRIETDGQAETAEPLPADAEFEREFEVLSQLDDEWREYFAQTNSFRGRSPEQEERRQLFFDSIVEKETLAHHLLGQLDFADLTPEQRKVAELIIGNINEDGYLLAPIEELAINSGVPLDDLQRALQVIQTFHPVGVGARDLRECLLIQLDRLGKSETPAAAIVRNHLDDLARKRFSDIARALRLTVEEVQEQAQFIATLEPKPGRLFSPDNQQYVAADVIVQQTEDGQYAVILNDAHVPHLCISNTYKELMASGDSNAEAREYIREKIRAGKFLIKSIHLRQQTIQRIAQVIVNHQRDFLEHGVARLKPLTMAQVAAEVGVHETTVSRAVANKYIQTPQGLFEMKYFFKPGFQTAGGGSLSNTSVKEQIAQLIAGEDRTHPYSDDQIVTLLKEKGIPIARRTVAKYRTELNILPSHLRKQF